MTKLQFFITCFLFGFCCGNEPGQKVPQLILKAMKKGETMTIYAENPSLDLLINETKTIQYNLAGNTTTDQIIFDFEPDPLGVIFPVDKFIISNETRNFSIEIKGQKRGKCTLKVLTNDPEISTTRAYVNIKVLFSDVLSDVSFAIGWMYFVAWSVSFYPQIYENFKTKSVVGLNFDFLALNIIGFTLYSIYNIGLYWIPSVQYDYMDRHFTLLIPVKLNDVIFGVHATFACIVTIAQCFIYERGNQTVSIVCRFIVFLIFSLILGMFIGSCVHKLKWLDFLTYASYIKLGITVIKYVPQAYMNFVRKSTIGWSIGNVLLDFTGGSLSMGQMIIDSYNNDDWTSFFGDFTKFGLGLFSVAFDVLFILQHYVCYPDRNPVHPEMERIMSDIESSEDSPFAVAVEDRPPSYGTTKETSREQVAEGHPPKC